MLASSLTPRTINHIKLNLSEDLLQLKATNQSLGMLFGVSSKMASSLLSVKTTWCCCFLPAMCAFLHTDWTLALLHTYSQVTTLVCVCVSHLCCFFVFSVGIFALKEACAPN